MKFVNKSLLAFFATTTLSAFAATPVATVPATEPTEQPVVDEQPAIEEQTPVDQEVQTPAEEQVPQEDLTFAGARWGGKAAGYVCAAKETIFVKTPSEYTGLNVKWGTVVTDFTLDNGLLLATFTPDESTTCRYSAIMLANSSTKTIKLVESRAFAAEGEGSCAAGKELLDTALAANKYLWKESRKHLTIIAPSASAEEICGEGVKTVGIDFVFTGKIN